MQSRGCCERGSGVQRVPCRGEGRGQARGEIVWQPARSHPQVRPPRSPGGAGDSPPGEAFLGTPRPTQIGAAGSLQPSPLSRPLESSGAAWVPRTLPKLIPAWSLHPGVRLPLIPRVSLCVSMGVCVCVYVRVWERPLCVCAGAGLPCPCLLSV